MRCRIKGLNIPAWMDDRDKRMLFYEECSMPDDEFSMRN